MVTVSAINRNVGTAAMTLQDVVNRLDYLELEGGHYSSAAIRALKLDIEIAIRHQDEAAAGKAKAAHAA